MKVEKVKVRSKRIIHQEHVDIDLSGVDTLRLMVLYQYTNDAINSTFTNVLAKNHILKRKLKELQDFANLVPL